MKKIILLILIFVGYLYPQAGNTIPRRVDTLETDVDSLYTKTSHIVKIEEYVGAYDTSDGWSLVIQAAVDANLETNNTILFSGNKTYLLEVQKTNPYEYSGTHKTCIDLKTGGFTLDLNNATLKLKDGQQTDVRGAVDIIVFRAAANLTIKNGAIIGNTAGQTGWTGGYDQNNNGMIIRGLSLTALGKDNRNIILEDLELSDHFSNPFKISGGYFIRTNNIRSWAVGEGYEVLNFDNVFGENIYLNDTTNVMIGDALEYSWCNKVFLSGISIDSSTSAGGVALELTGSRDVIVDGFIVNAWNAGVNNNNQGYNILFQNGIIRNMEIGLYTNGSVMKFNNILSEDCNIGIIAYSDVDTTFDISNVKFIGGNNGIYAYRTIKADISNCTFNGVVNGIQIINQSRSVGAASPIINISNCIFKSGTTAITVAQNTDTTFKPIVRVNSSIFENYTNLISNPTTSRYLELINCSTGQLSTYASGGVLNIVGYDDIKITIGQTISSITGGYKNQEIRILFNQITGVMSNGGTGSQIYLNKFTDEGFQIGDELFLKYNIDNNVWYETNRIVLGNSASSNSVIVDGYYYDNVNDSVSTATELLRLSGTLGSRFYVPKKCKIKSWGVISSQARTAGTLTVGLWWDDTGPNRTLVLDGTNTTTNSTRFYRSTQVDLNANQYIHIKYTTSNDFAPTTADITVWVELEY